MTSKIKTNGLFALLAIAAFASSFAVTEAFATSYSGPSFDDQDELEIGAISYVTSHSSNSEEGDASFRAFRDSGISTAGQASIEYRKQITVFSGDDLVIEASGTSDYARFYGSNTYSHVAVHPTITPYFVGLHGDVQGTYCDLSFTPIESNVYSNTSVSGDLECDGLPAGDYYVSAYVHVRTDNVQNSQVRADVFDIELDIQVN